MNEKTKANWKKSWQSIVQSVGIEKRMEEFFYFWQKSKYGDSIDLIIGKDNLQPIFKDLLIKRKIKFLQYSIFEIWGFVYAFAMVKKDAMFLLQLQINANYHAEKYPPEEAVKRTLLMSTEMFMERSYEK